MNRVFVTGGSGFIGTNFILYLASKGVEAVNYDIQPPKVDMPSSRYVAGDIMDLEKLQRSVKEAKPEAMIHLAARCDLAGATLADYRTNTVGVQNIIDVVRKTNSIERAIFTSSRYVHCNERQPTRNDEYSPFTMYGRSKVEGERLVRASGLERTWIIVRPTSIWGPWFDIPYRGFFDAVRRGLYVHPRGEQLYKSYGFVENTALQYWGILNAPASQVHEQVYYAADYKPIEVRSMAETIRCHFDSPPIRDVSLSVLKAMAALGDGLKKVGWYNPPLSSFRLNNMRTQMVYDISATEKVVGSLPYNMEGGVGKTVEWMKQH